MSCIIGIDLGSNSLGVVKFDCKKREVIDSCSFTVRTASSLVDKGIIDEGAISRIIEALNIAKDRLDFTNCKIKAVTTEAMRVATNSKEVISKIKENTGIEFEIIDSTQEAILTLKAVKNRLEIMGIDKDFVVVDIGGASTEVTFYIDNKIYTKSFKLGIVTVVSEAKDLDNIEKLIEKLSEPILDYIKEFNNKELIFVATAGTPTTIAALKHNLNYETYNGKVVNGTILTYDDLNFYLEKLIKMDKKNRQIAVGVGREDLIIAGVLIFRKFYDMLKKDKSIVIDDSLREGVALEFC